MQGLEIRFNEVINLKKGVRSFLLTIGGLALGLIFYLLYVHVISLFAYPVSIVYAAFIILVLGGFIIVLFSNLKDFVISMFKDNKEVDEKGFKKHF